jgi:hypothetical protein
VSWLSVLGDEENEEWQMRQLTISLWADSQRYVVLRRKLTLSNTRSPADKPPAVCEKNKV